MKNIFVLSITVFCLGLIGCNSDKNSKPMKNTTVSVEISDVDTVILSEIHPQEAIAIDTQLIVNGKSTFNFDVENPGFYSLIYDGKASTTLFVEKGDQITVEQDTVNNVLLLNLGGLKTLKILRSYLNFKIPTLEPNNTLQKMLKVLQKLSLIP